MKRTTLCCGLIAAALFGMRLFEVLTNIEPASGFFTQPRTAFHLLSLLLGAVGLWPVYRTVKGKTPVTAGALALGGAVPFGICACTGAVSAYGCLLWAVRILRAHPLHHFFMSREQLAALGFIQADFKLALPAALIGFFAASWFILAAVGLLREGRLVSSPYFALVPVLWYGIRVIAGMVGRITNLNDSVQVSSLLSCAALCCVWMQIAAYISLAETAQRLCKLSLWGFAAVCASVGFAAPNLVVAVSRGDFPAAVLYIADAFSALFAAEIARRATLFAKEKDNV